MLSQLGGPLLLTDSDADLSATEGLRVLCPRTLLQQSASLREVVPWPDTPDDAALYVMFTSGSTGAPKGVLIPHRAVHRLVYGADYAELRADARWALQSSLAFDASTLELWAPLLNGGCCVVQQMQQPSLDDTAGFLHSRRITDAWLTSALFNAMVDEQLQAFAGMQQLLTGGERVSPDHARRCLQAWPTLRLINGYGPTENTTFSLCHTVGPADLGGGDLPIGRPIHGTQARVAGPDGQDMPDGQTGELWVSGDGLALGYLDDETLTAQRFVHLQGTRWYRTGDMVRRTPNGVHHFLGRADRQVKLAGHRIELDEVERAVRACPGVGDAAVWVQGDRADTRHLVAFYDGVAAPNETTVAEALARILPPHACPAKLNRMARLPANLNGKVDRALLAQRSASFEPRAAPAGAVAFSQAEQLVAKAWAAVLGTVPTDREAVFQRCGGGSLAALRVAAELQRLAGRQVPPVQLLRRPRLADHAVLLDQAPAVRPVETAFPDDMLPLPLGPSAQALVQASALDGGAGAYLVHLAMHLPEAISRRSLRSAFAALAQRHAILRAAVAWQGGQVTAARRDALPAGWWVEHRPLGPLPEDFAWPSALTPVVQRPMPLRDAGPMRVDVWPLRGGGTLCVWTVHHFAVDEASLDYALEELGQLTAGEAMPPPYGGPDGFAALEEAAIDEAGIAAIAAEAATALAHHAPPLPAPPGAGAEQTLGLPEGLDALLLAACSRWGCTPFTPVVVACGLALQQVFGTAWRFVLTPFSRRGEPELLEPLGYLLDLRLVEAGARPGEALPQTLARVHAQLLAAHGMRFQPLPRLAQAVDALAPGASAGLTQFALTWRQDPLRTRPLGPVRARLLHVPQAGARFGLALHLWATSGGLQARIEAVDAAVADGRAAAFGRAFAQQLWRLCVSAQGPIEAAAPALPAPSGHAVQAAAARAWQRWLGQPPADDDTHFLRAGGSSLLALRVAATLRREAGMALDVGAFLATPTFGRLCTLLRPPPPDSGELLTLVGPQHAAQLLLLLPGMLVGTLGMFELARALQARLPPGHAVAIVDTDALLQRAPPQQPAGYMAQRLQQLVHELGADRVAGVVGYSVGGVLALQLAQLMGAPWARRVPLWLLDTYAPCHTRMRTGTRARRALVSLARHPLGTSRLLAERWRNRAGPAAPAAPGGTRQGLQLQWHALLDELATATLDTAAVHATLLHSIGAARSAGVWRHAASNGFDPANFARLDVLPIEGTHYDLRARLVPLVSDLVAGQGRPA